MLFRPEVVSAECFSPRLSVTSAIVYPSRGREDHHGRRSILYRSSRSWSNILSVPDKKWEVEVWNPQNYAAQRTTLDEGICREPLCESRW